jgi:hypothetical protein
VLLTALATIGFGEHYVTDLIFAIPLAAAAWHFAGRRWRPAAFCTLGLFGALLAIRFH